MFLTCTGLMPTAAPTVAPSYIPTSVPTASPSIPSTICTSSCVILGASNIVAISMGATYNHYILPRFFKFSFRVRVPSLVEDTLAPWRNILDFKDAVSGQRLLAVYVTDTLALQYHYGTQTLTAVGPGLISNYDSAFTVVTMWVNHDSIQIVSTGQSGAMVSIPLTGASIDTTGRSYVMYRSNPDDPSSTGILQDVFFSGEISYA